MFVKKKGVGNEGGVSIVLVSGCSHGEAVNKKGERGMNTAVQPRPNVRRAQKSQNEVRADRVKGALDYYRVTGVREPGASLETVLSDFLSDLRHLCDRADLDLMRLDRLAHRTYHTEKFAR